MAAQKTPFVRPGQAGIWNCFNERSAGSLIPARPGEGIAANHPLDITFIARFWTRKNDPTTGRKQT